MFDIIFILVLLFVVAISLIFGFTIYSKFTGSIEKQNLNTSATYNAGLANLDTAWNIWDTVFVFILGGGLLSIIITSFMLRSHPIFFVLSLIFTVCIIVVAAIITNVYQEVGNNVLLDDGTAAANSFPNIAAVMNNLPLIVLVTFVLVSIILYSRGTSIAGSNAGI